MKWKLLTVQEYKAATGLSLAAIYKQVDQGRVGHVKKFGRILIKFKEKELI